MNWTLEQVLTFAPDPAVGKDAKKLAIPAKWPTLGHDEHCAWGECKGSAAKPYRVEIDLSEPAFHCNCPSRKFPCKHGLALFLMLVGQPDRLSDHTPPTWVTDWLAERAARAEKKAQKESVGRKPVDTVAQAKRADQRRSKVTAGIQALDLWLQDLVRNGLVNVQGQPPAFWEQIAARMIDAQAPGLARRLRDMGGITMSGQGWQERLLEQIGSLYLLIDAFSRIDDLPPALQEDVRMLIGWPANQDEILASPGVRDCWLVVGQASTREDRLITRRSRLQSTGAEPHYALVLEFTQVNQAKMNSLGAGATIDAELCFFPGAMPQRALVKGHPTLVEAPEPLNGYGSIREARRAYAAALACNPWLDAFPFTLTAVIPDQREDACVLRDADSTVLPLHPGFQHTWELLAMSGGHPVGIFGEWDGHALMPLSVWSDGRFVNFAEG